MAMNGTDVLLLVNTGTIQSPVYEVVGSQRGVSFPENTENIDVSSKDSRAGRVLAGRYNATISMEALYVPSDAAYQALKTAMRDGEMIKVRRSESAIETEECDAVINSLSPEFPDQEEAVISIELTVDGFWVEVGS